MYIKDVGTCNKGFGFASESVPSDSASAMPYHPMEAVKQLLWDRMYCSESVVFQGIPGVPKNRSKQ